MKKEKLQMINDRDRMKIEKDQMMNDRDQMKIERDQMMNDRDQMKIEKDQMMNDRDRVKVLLDQMMNETDRMMNNRDQMKSKRDQLLKEVELQKFHSIMFASISLLFVLYILYKSGVLFHFALLFLSLECLMSVYVLANNETYKRGFSKLIVDFPIMIILFTTIIMYVLHPTL